MSPTRTPREILKRARLSVTDGSGVLFATDQETSIRQVLPEIEVLEPGDVLLPVSETAQIVRELPDEAIEIESDGSRITLRAAHSEFKIPEIDPQEFPELPDTENVPAFSLDSTSLRNAIRRTLFATDTEGPRYALGGVLLELQKDPPVFVATDSRRLAVARVDVKAADATNTPEKPLVPAKALQLVDRTLGGAETSVELGFRANEVFFQLGPTTIISRLIDGRFPEYERVIPRGLEHRIEMVVGPLHAAVRQAQIFTDEDTRSVTFHLQPGVLVLHSASKDAGESRVELPVTYDGPEQRVAFDSRYVSEMLRALDPEETLIFELSDKDHPAVFRLANDTYLYVLMPISIDE